MFTSCTPIYKEELHGFLPWFYNVHRSFSAHKANEALEEFYERMPAEARQCGGEVGFGVFNRMVNNK